MWSPSTNTGGQIFVRRLHIVVLIMHTANSLPTYIPTYLPTHLLIQHIWNKGYPHYCYCHPNALFLTFCHGLVLWQTFSAIPLHCCLIMLFIYLYCNCNILSLLFHIMEKLLYFDMIIFSNKNIRRFKFKWLIRWLYYKGKGNIELLFQKYLRRNQFINQIQSKDISQKT